MLINSLQNKSIALLGFGKEGRSTLEFLLKIALSNITVLDSGENILIEHKGINVVCGVDYLDSLGEFDIIIKSPGISPYHPKIFPYIDKITSQTEIFFSNYQGKIIGVTATKGKTTTASILHQTLLNAGYSSELVGNIGQPVFNTSLAGSLLGTGNSHRPTDYVVYELSSYMLENFAPVLYIGLLGNIFPDHIDWHNNSFSIYKQAKLNILKHAQYPLDGRVILSTPSNILTDVETPLLGDHNMRNISLVYSVCQIVGISESILRETVKTFHAIPHRLERVVEKEGITFIDDAISTTPESTIEAIKTFGGRIGTIFLGGLDRGYDFGELVGIIQEYGITNIVLLPETGYIIKELLLTTPYGLDGKYNILVSKSMKEAICFSFDHCGKGEICLLSTASPSLNLYKNYIAQGNDFKKEILLYKKR